MPRLRLVWNPFPLSNATHGLTHRPTNRSSLGSQADSYLLAYWALAVCPEDPSAFLPRTHSDSVTQSGSFSELNCLPPE